jgi:hypothetical protein
LVITITTIEQGAEGAYLGLRGTREQGSGENYITKSLMTCTSYQIFFGDQIEKNEMGWACSTYRERRRVYRVLVGNSEVKRPLGRYRCRREDNSKMDYQEV